MDRIVAVLLLLTPLTSAQTCFVSAGVAADESVVPCGTAVDAACCQLGSVCLWDSACWNPDNNVTYIYGCTDANYGAAVCPWKCGPGYSDAPIVDLQYCGAVREGIWSCAHPNLAGQHCEGDAQVAFAAPSFINPILSLPSVAGGSTGYYSEVSPNTYNLVAGYTPTSLPVVIPWKPTAPVEVMSVNPTTTTSSPPTSSATARSSSKSHASSVRSLIVPSASTTASKSTSISVSSSTASASAVRSSSGLSTGAKAGIGVGVALGVLSVVVLGLAFFYIRRKRRGNHKTGPHQEIQYYKSGQQRPYSNGPAEMDSPVPSSVQRRGELQGDTSYRYSDNTSSLPEMSSDPRDSMRTSIPPVEKS